MGLKRVAFFGPFALKQLGGIPSHRAVMVDERIINYAALQNYLPFLAIVDAHSRKLEYCGDQVPIYEMDQLLNPIVEIPEEVAAEIAAAEAERIAVNKIKPEIKPVKKVKKEIPAAGEENPTIVEGTPEKKKRKKRDDEWKFNF